MAAADHDGGPARAPGTSPPRWRDRPLEPLFTLRLFYAVGGLLCAGLVLSPGWPQLNRPLVAVVAGVSLVLSAILWRVRRLSGVMSHLLSLAGMAGVCLMVWAGEGSSISYCFAAFLVWSGVCVGLHHSARQVVGYMALAAGGLAAALLPHLGLLDTAIATALIIGAIASSALVATVLMGTLRAQARVDATTGILNANGLNELAGPRVSTRPHAVAVVALPALRDIRTAFGYQAADQVLGQVAAVLAAGAGVPVVGRTDADELVVIIGPMAGGSGDPDRLAGILEATRRRVSEETYRAGDVAVPMPAHVGGIEYAGTEASLDELIRRASYAADQAANQDLPTAAWSGYAGAVSVEDMTLVADLAQASARGELWLAYQPQVAAVDGSLRGVEALLRWDHPRLGAVPPGRFIVLAERCGQIDGITDWVLDQALAAQARWRSDGLEVPVSVNISGRSLAQPGLAGRVAAALDGHGLDPRCLTLEVTETAVTANAERAASLLGPLRDAGVRISLDDFGTGFTSLGLLPTLPLDEVKLDGGFVWRSGDSPADAAIARSVRELAGRLGLDTVAEGIEDEAAAIRITALGYDLLQGYFHGRPMAEADFLGFVGRDRGAPGDPGGPPRSASTARPQAALA